jgi:ribonuclease P protein component
MLIGVLLGQGEEAARFGMVTSKKVGGAVVRNAVRRRLREVARHARPTLKPGVWLVTIAKKAAGEASLAELRDEWTRLARKAACFQE